MISTHQVNSKSVICKFSNNNWNFFNANLRTCSIQGQAISYIGFKIAFSLDRDSKGFSIKHNKKVQFIPENLSKILPNLIGVEIWNCSLRIVGVNHFKDLSELLLLDLSFNVIEKIDSYSFIDNSKLKKLLLSHNKINHVNDNLFDPLLNLKALHLSHNKIKFIDSKTFQRLVNIENILLNNNELETIEKNLLKNNQTLNGFGSITTK